jgi:hypothetical protein
MKLTLLLLFMTCSSLSLKVFCQERVNREKLSFGSTSGILEKCTGWAYNSKIGEWIGYENVISENKDFKEKYSILQGEKMMSRVFQNFLKMQIKTLGFNGATYYVLVVEKWSGRYEYPSLELDWYSFKEVLGFVFSQEEYQKFSKLEGQIELKTKYRVNLGSKYEEYDEIKFLDLLQSELSQEKTKYSIEYKFPILLTKENAVRFYIPDSFSSYSNYDFEKKYFETDLENFSRLVI